MLRAYGPLMLASLLSATVMDAQQYDLRTLSLEEGLPSAAVNALCEDADGFLWVGTMQGAARSEGLHFETIDRSHGLSDDQVTALASSNDGRVWVGCANGAVSVRGGGVITTISGPAADASAIRALWARDQEVWWVDKSEGAVRWQEGRVTTYGTDQGLPFTPVRALIGDVRGRVIAGTDSGLFLFNGRRWTRVPSSHQLPDLRVTALFADSAGVLVGTAAGYLELDTALRALPLQERFTGTLPIALPDPRIFAVLRARNGDLWFGTQSGLMQLRSINGSPALRVITEANGLGHPLVRCLLQDRSGAIWAGTAFGGVSKFTSDAFMHFTDRDGLRSRTVSALHRTPDGLLWLGTAGGGLGCWDGTNLRVLDHEQGLADAFVLALGEDVNGHLLVGTAAHGLFRLKGEHFEQVTGAAGLYGRRVFRILLDDEGRCWVCTDHGVYVDPGDHTFSRVDGFEQTATDAVTNGDTLWATTSEGLYVLPTRKLPWRLRQEVLLPPLSMTAVERDHAGNLWIGTEGHGLFRFHHGRVDSLNVESGLGSNAVEQVLLDALQNVWLGTRRGIDMLELDVLQEEVIDIRHFGADEGFIGIECFRNAALLDTDSALWFGTVRGATRYDPDRVLEEVREPLVHLTDLRLFYERPDWGPWCTGTDRRGLPAHLELPYNKNHLTFAFTGISLAYPEKVRYRYMLEGHDPDWSPITPTDRVTYSNIPPGDYTFKVMARNAGGVWTEQPVSYGFSIAPPFWQTSTFRVGGGGVLLLGFFGFVRLRTRRLRLERERLERTVRQRTSELAAEKDRSEELLRNILPAATAEELKAKGRADARRYEACTVLFSDFKGFTSFSSRLDSDTLVSELHHYFGLFDRLCDQHGVEKIKTIGDAYMCAAGIPMPRSTHALDAVLMAFAMLDAVERSNAERRARGEQEWPIRIGLHSGPVVAGVVGTRKFAYDIWGDTVNLASRMESNGTAGHVNISGPVYAQVMELVEAQPRGPIKVKGKGEMQMYFALRLKKEFSADEKGWVPNAALAGTVSAAKRMRTVS